MVRIKNNLRKLLHLKGYLELQIDIRDQICNWMDITIINVKEH